MSWVSTEVVEILTFLLPGFVSAAVFYSLTSHPRPSDFVSVVHALIFTMFVQAIVFLLPLEGLSGRIDDKDGLVTETIVSLPVALTMGVLAAWVSNQDKLYALLRWMRLTRENSYPSEWYSSFANHEERYVVLHLVGDRRLMGWLEEWPSSSERGHFRLAEASWLLDDGEDRLIGVAAIMITANQVEMVEFMEPETRKTKGSE